MTKPLQADRIIANVPSAPLCDQKFQLTVAFLHATQVLMELHNQQTKAVIDGDPDFERFDDLIHVAREDKDGAKYALIAHLGEHRC